MHSFFFFFFEDLSILERESGEEGAEGIFKPTPVEHRARLGARFHDP